MRPYADSSFIVKLVTDEEGSDEARAEYRRLRLPTLPLLPLHELEIGNSIRQHAFHNRRTTRSSERSLIKLERDKALARLEKWRMRGWLLPTSESLDDSMERARLLSERHTERFGCRSLDLLHVALAIQLGCDIFITTDDVQGQVANAEGLKVHNVPWK